ncbi:hypothetical protein [Tahibacter amnicola]|uniref:Uncharacterized protein n=1 Tax=Tahibacter amnicola TaxID=2976241 RepID=A0ABY6BEB4_9GAMM|nr:hypothetical protein [Tahibacter amnicola]UXI67936.1 hypothetical protein N4264_24950 [Tahibacter amnicola]
MRRIRSPTDAATERARREAAVRDHMLDDHPDPEDAVFTAPERGTGGI